MTMVVNDLNDMTVARNEHAVYVKDSNVLLKLYRESASIIDLENALKAGKTCKKYCFTFADADNGYCGLCYFLDDLPFAEFVNNCRVISPFAAVKKQDFTKGIINGAKLAKAILAGQVKEIVCAGRYTDDYYDDAKRNFCKGRKITDFLKFADELITQTTCFSADRTDNPKVIACGWGTWECYEAILV